MTDRLRVSWPDPAPFVARGSRPIRILAVSDEPDPTLDSAGTRNALGTIDLIIGAGDLEPDYLSFVSDAFHAPLRYVRGNHDVGSAWTHTERVLLPQPMPDATVVEELGLRLIGFSGSPIYNERGMQVSAIGMWAKVTLAWWRQETTAIFDATGKNKPSHPVAKALAEVGFRVARFEFGYMAARRLGERRPPPKAETVMPELNP